MPPATKKPNRIQLSVMTVAPETHAQIIAWNQQGVPISRIIDRLVTHAAWIGFDPVTCKGFVVPPTKTEMPTPAKQGPANSAPALTQELTTGKTVVKPKK